MSDVFFCAPVINASELENPVTDPQTPCARHVMSCYFSASDSRSDCTEHTSDQSRPNPLCRWCTANTCYMTDSGGLILHAGLSRNWKLMCLSWRRVFIEFPQRRDSLDVRNLFESPEGLYQSEGIVNSSLKAERMSSLTPEITQTRIHLNDR